MEAYFDNSATTIVSDSVKELVVKTMTKDYGNPSSMHIVGVNAEKYITDAKEKIAQTLKVTPKEIYFTSGGTESNNMAIFGSIKANRRSGNRIITTCVEHASVSAVMKELEKQDFEVIYLPVDEHGVILFDELKKAMTKDTILVSTIHVNNEVGAIEPVEEIGKYIKQINPNVIFHVDAIQSYGKMRIRPKNCMIDLMSVSGHKIHGPKGVGFLYVRQNTKIRPILFGGGQQKGMRSGTENVPGIAGIGQAAKECYDAIDENVSKITDLKDYLIDELCKLNDVTVNSRKGTDGAPHIVSVSVRGIRSEVLLHALEDKGIYISAGSACASNKPAISETLKAMGVKKELLDSTVRFSFSKWNTSREVDYAITQLKELLPVLRKYVRR